MKTDPELVGACFKVIDRLAKHGVGTNAGAYSFMLTGAGDKPIWELATIAELVAFADALDFAAARSGAEAKPMKTQQEIINDFEDVSVRLEKHGIKIESNGHFLLKSSGKTVGAADTVDGLAAFADALDFVEGSGAPETAGTDPAKR